MTTRALILGAKSAIAQAVADRLAHEYACDLILGARHSEELRPYASDLALHTGRNIQLLEYDALDLENAAGLPGRACAQGGDFDLVVLVFGYLGQQNRAQQEDGELLRIIHTNYTAAAIALTHLSTYLEGRQQPGGIIGISSVAGDRGRQSNYAYGSAKGALTLFLQGLRNRLAPGGIHVLTVKPGFVDTPMTRDLEGLFLVASPQRVARDILRAYEKGRDVLYTPWFWRWIMAIIRAIPERLFKRLHL